MNTSDKGASGSAASRGRRKYVRKSFVRLQEDDDGYEDEEVVFGDSTQLPSGGRISSAKSYEDPVDRAREMFQDDDDDDLLVTRQDTNYSYHNYRSSGCIKVLYGVAIVGVIALACVTGIATTKHLIQRGKDASIADQSSVVNVPPPNVDEVYDHVGDKDGGVLPDNNDGDTTWKQTPPSTFDMDDALDTDSDPNLFALKDAILVNYLSSQADLRPGANSPQRKALRWMAFHDPAQPNANAGTGAIPTLLKRYALTTLFFATDGPQWTYNNGWLLDPNICEWYGIHCDLVADDNGIATRTEVTGITLARNHLIGPIPGEIFRRLTDLNLLSLHTNELIGTLSEDVQHLKQLETLALFNNTIGGSIPPTIGLMTSLTNVLLSGNRFLGNIPPQMGQLQRLQQLHLYDNSLFGVIPSLTQCTQLKRLWLSQNRLSGRLPRNFFGALPNLEAFYVDDNFLSGPLGGETLLGDATNLKDFRVYKNLFSSNIPGDDLRRLTKLELLYMDQNQLDGTIPSFSGLSQLRELSLFSNKLVGAIPTTLATDLPALQVLDVGNNRLEGAIPESLGDLTRLQKLRAYRNTLIGTVPDSLRRCPLDDLQLQHNSLNGELSTWMFDSNSKLRILFVSDNQFRGSIPTTIPPTMLHLRLDRNNLVGSVPYAMCLQTMRELIVDCDVSCSCCTSCVSNDPQVTVQDKNWNL